LAFSQQPRLHHLGIIVSDFVQLDAGRLWINFLPPAYTRRSIVEYVETKAKAQA
jgi:hypothetical protein